VNIAGEAVELRDEEGRLELPALLQGLLELRALVESVGPLPRLDLGELGRELPSPAIEVGRDCLTLGVEPETGAALGLGADAVVSDEFARRHVDPPG